MSARAPKLDLLVVARCAGVSATGSRPLVHPNRDNTESNTQILRISIWPRQQTDRHSVNIREFWFSAWSAPAGYVSVGCAAL